VRVSTYPTVTGEKIVLRLFQTGAARQLSELELPPDALEELRRFLGQTSGLLLISGPAGSGKTTTIYACLQELTGKRSRNIVTIEDPVEQVLSGVTQTEINEARGLDFAQAARHLLRQDPDVLVIGEIRDEATAAIALRAAFTGHLVISTLHAGSAKGVADRFLDLSADPVAVANCLELVLNQRLVRKLCVACHGKACEQCLGTGYHGRIPIMEFIRVAEPHRQAIRARELATFVPGISLADRAKTLVTSGITNQSELERVLGL
jgi:type II secretory ATPase GspE/PulE/Tfp pilus assembly ATPase PilB-like protein